MTDDLSKWRLEHWIDVPWGGWPKQKVRVDATNEWDGGEPKYIDIFVEDWCTKTSVRMSLDDAENFATLILYEVKRAKGEL